MSKKQKKEDHLKKELVYLNPKDLVPNDKNPRKIKKDRLDMLKKSITEFSKMLEINPIKVDENKMILAGNMRAEACVKLKIEKVPVEIIYDLTEDEKAEFMLKDNAHYGEWDSDILFHDYDTDLLKSYGIDVKVKEIPEEDKEFLKQFDDVDNENATYPIVPDFDEKHEMFIIVSDNEVDSNWLRQKLNMQKMKSYKRGGTSKSNVVHVNDLKDVL